MNQRAEIFSLIADIRGRLDELEGVVRALPGSTVPTPASFDEPGVENLTPESCLEFRRDGLPGLVAMTPYERRLPFYQMGTADTSLPIVIESFELSSLHKAGPEPAFGLQVTPTGPQQPWLTHDFSVSASTVLGLQWSEWILKLSAPEPLDITVQFCVAGQGFAEKIPHSRIRVTEFASFCHLRIGGDVLRAALKDREATEVRVMLGTGGKVVPLRIYSFLVFGKR